MYKVILKKKSSKHSNLSENEYEGYTFDLPTIGEKFLLVGESMDITDLLNEEETEELADLDPANIQVRTLKVITTPVTLLDTESYTFSTENSIYQLFILEVIGLEPEDIQ